MRHKMPLRDKGLCDGCRTLLELYCKCHISNFARESVEGEGEIYI
jgi:hypothetical protein